MCVYVCVWGWGVKWWCAVFQHVHRRSLRLRDPYAFPTPHSLLPRRHHFLHLPLSGNFSSYCRAPGGRYVKVCCDSRYFNVCLALTASHLSNGYQEEGRLVAGTVSHSFSVDRDFRMSLREASVSFQRSEPEHS